MSPRWIVLIIFVLTLGVGLFDYPQIYNQSAGWIGQKIGWNIPQLKPKDFKLGLDLRGGAHLEYQADLSRIAFPEREDSMQGVRDVIERRVNALGISEPLVQVAGADRLIVELAGVTDVNEAIKKIGETPLLEFKEEFREEDRKLTPAQEDELKKFNQKASEKVNLIYKELRKKDFAAVAKQYSEDEATKDKGGDAGWIAEDIIDPAMLSKIKPLKKGVYAATPYETENKYDIVRLEDKRKELPAVESYHLLICYKGAQSCDQEYSKEEAKQKISELKAKANKDNFVELVKANSTEPKANETGGYLGFMKKGFLVPEFENVLFAIKDGQISDVVETVYGYHLIYRVRADTMTEYKMNIITVKKKTREEMLPQTEDWKNTPLSGVQLKKAQLAFDPQTGLPQVSLTFDNEGAKLFKEITTRNVNRPVDVFLDGFPISLPRVNEPITDGQAVITGRFTIPEAKELVRRLNAGALPVPVQLLSQQTIDAVLGAESLQKSLRAGMYGLILVMVFMIIYYRLPGLTASLSLLIYGVITLGLFKLLGVTLTLAGIAGFILSIGMAVDANVLIFERLKEELRAGRSLGSALEEAFRRAWLSIRDSNLSTILTCLILMFFSTSFVKGFAITLMIGVLISMFTALMVTRNLLLVIIRTWLGRHPRLYLGWRKTT